MPPLSSGCSILRWVGHSALPARQKTAVVPRRAILTVATSVSRRYQNEFWLGGFTSRAFGFLTRSAPKRVAIFFIARPQWIFTATSLTTVCGFVPRSDRKR